jgi:hypothetical protein
MYGFENCNSFSEFKLIILARTFVGIRHRQTLEFVGSPNLLSKVMNFGIRVPPNFDNNVGRRNHAGARIRRRSTVVAGLCFSPFVVFSYEPNARKIIL